MLTDAVRVCGPGVAVLVSHVYQYVVPVIVRLVSTAPSTDSVTVFGWPHAAVVESPTDCPPLTDAPDSGQLNDTVKLADGGAALLTVTVREVVPEAFAESVTVAVSVCAPLPTVAVFQLKLGLVPL